MSTEKKSSVSTGAAFVAGVVLMVGGMFLRSKTEGLKESLEKMGLPIDLGMTVAVIGVFLILFPVIQFFFITPLGDAINDRNNTLEQTFTEAEELRAEMQKMRADYEAQLVRTEADARATIQAEVKKAQELGASLRAEATKRADEMIAKAEQEISAEKARAINDIRVHVVDLSLAAAEKIIGENMTTDRNRKLVEDFINGVEVSA